MSATIQKRYEYKVSRGGVFIGILQRVASDFSYSQAINTAGAQLQITVGMTADTAAQPVNPILDETGEIITDEVGQSILEERYPDLVGDAADNILIRNDNDVDVYEFSSRYPNGVLVFKGYISKWKAVFGADDNVLVTVISHGQDLNHYVNPGGTADVLDQSQATTDEAFGTWGPAGSSPERIYGQTFVVGAGVTNLSAIILGLGIGDDLVDTQPITLKLWSGVTAFAGGSGTPLGQVTVQVTGNNSYVTPLPDYTFQFATPITVVAGMTYFFTLHNDPSGGSSDISTWLLFNKNTTSYTNGAMYRSTGGAAPVEQVYDLYFKTYYSTNSTVKTYTSSDPSTTLTSLLTYYLASGGSIAKQPGGYSLTGLTPVQTTFKLNTILEAIQILQSLAPSDWYWYVDPADDILYWKQAATTATHKLIKGRHLQKLEVEATKEDIANVVYFTGGPTAGVNLFVNINDAASLVANRRGLARISNNRVTDTSTGQLIAQNYNNEHDNQTYITQVTISDATYDINLFNIGEIVGFEGFGTLVDNLLLQIVGITRNVDNVVLSLGVLPPRQTELTTQINRELSDVQTVANPTTPS